MRIGIGLVNKDSIITGKIPGWESNSIGYHSDDGNIFISKTTGEKYGPTFTDKDVIGCCMDFLNKISFFTKNGEKLKSVEFYSLEDLYPAVSLRKKDQEIRMNYGDREFIYDIKSYIIQEKNRILEDISKINLNFEKMEINATKYYEKAFHHTIENNPKEDEYKLVMDYLIYYVYCKFIFN